jgi:hypothetical protein
MPFGMASWRIPVVALTPSVLTCVDLDHLERLREPGMEVDILTIGLASTDVWWAYGSSPGDHRWPTARMLC